MKKKFLFLSILVLFFTIFSFSRTNTAPTGEFTRLGGLIFKNSNKSGNGCAACVFIVRLFEVFAIGEEITAEKALEKICKIFPTNLRSTCDTLVKKLGKDVANLLDKGYTADKICETIHECEKKCVLYKNIKFNDYFTLKKNFEKKNSNIKKILQKKETFPKDSIENKWWEKVKQVFTQHTPVDDFDNDYFSSEQETFRGTDWKGKDCSPKNPDVYPGRKIFNEKTTNKTEDYNCNGIFGIDPKTGKTYEDLFCGDTPNRRGFVALGDSCSARFRIPDVFFYPKGLNEQTLLALEKLIENEFDFPQYSWVTGHKNITDRDKSIISGKVNSIYLEMVRRNRCVKGDFQNIGVNGNDLILMTERVKLIKRDPKNDFPLTVFISSFGNDICQTEPGFDKMTPVQVFHDKIVEVVEYLKNILPNDSAIIFFGVGDGTILYKSLHNKIHPIGAPYPDFYDFLSCVGINPCWGWMNNNATIRNKSTEYANKLNEQYLKVIKERSHLYTNFKMIYAGNIMNEIYEEFWREGKDTSVLIEPVDGFHPSQISHFLFSTKYINWLKKDHAWVLGNINRHNNEIDKKFGN